MVIKRSRQSNLYRKRIECQAADGWGTSIFRVDWHGYFRLIRAPKRQTIGIKKEEEENNEVESHQGLWVPTLWSCLCLYNSPLFQSPFSGRQQKAKNRVSHDNAVKAAPALTPHSGNGSFKRHSRRSHQRGLDRKKRKKDFFPFFLLILSPSRRE